MSRPSFPFSFDHYNSIWRGNIQGDSEEKSVCWEVIVLVIVREKIHMNLCLILNSYRDRAL